MAAAEGRYCWVVYHDEGYTAELEATETQPARPTKTGREPADQDRVEKVAVTRRRPSRGRLCAARAGSATHQLSIVSKTAFWVNT